MPSAGRTPQIPAISARLVAVTPILLLLLWALAAPLPTAAGPATASPTRATLLLPGGALSLSDRGEIRNLRLIEVDDSPILLATWDEWQTGASVPHCGISLDGVEFARITPVSYELGLRYARFDPLRGEPEIDERLASDAGMGLFIVQCVTQPLEIFRRQIAARGGTVRHYLAQYAYLVEMLPAAHEAIARLPYVRWVGPYHPAYRLELELVDRLTRSPAGLPPLAYNILVLEAAQRAVVAERIAGIGGTVRRAEAGKRVVEAELTAEQLRRVVRWDEVAFVDRWGAYELDMNIVREISGANQLETLAGYTGEGVRGEIFDAAFNLQHVDFQSRPLIEHGGPVDTGYHGAEGSGVLFGDGTGNPMGRGLLPSGQGIVADYDNVGLSGQSRYDHAAELLTPPYEAVFQSSSVGSPRNLVYSTLAAEHDQLLFDLDIVVCQANGNSGNPQSRPESWAKNLITVGGIYHYDTLDKSDDCWCFGASSGPASDGRIKPELSHFYDQTFTVSCCEPDSYNPAFGGTSGSTAIVCGHAGLFFQMWSDGIFGNEVLPGGSVFDNRSHMTTAKAMLVHTADQYEFLGLGHDLGRMNQGWGLPNVHNLYAWREQIFVIDESDVLPPFGASVYRLEVLSGQPAFRATMTYADPPGIPAIQSQHRINDLDLTVTSPSGTTYHGNVGLLESPWSAPGGDADGLNTLENVFVESPEAGIWTVVVSAPELIEDGHVETTELDADYALVVSPVVPETTGIPPTAAPAAGLRFEILAREPGIRGAMLSFELAASTLVEVDIYDVQGRLVAPLLSERLPAGPHVLSWDGIAQDGEPVGAGVYFVRLRAGERSVSGKVLLVQ